MSWARSAATSEIASPTISIGIRTADDQPEVAANEVEAAGKRAAHGAALDLDHRRGQPEVDEGEHAGHEEQRQPDGDDDDEDEVDRDQPTVADHPRHFAQRRRLSVVRGG